MRHCIVSAVENAAGSKGTNRTVPSASQAAETVEMCTGIKEMVHCSALQTPFIMNVKHEKGVSL